MKTVTDYSDWSGNDSYNLYLNKDNEIVSDNEYVLCIEKKNEEFVILNLTDIQLGPDDINKTGLFEQFKNILQELIQRTNPDLITITGDQTYFGNEYVLNNLLKEIDSHGILWAPIIGNHDPLEKEPVQGEITSFQQGELYKTFKYCLYKQGPKDMAYDKFGNECVGNYIINVVKKDKNGFQVLRSLILMNSGNRLDYKKEDYENKKTANDNNYSKLSDKQVEWYLWASKNVQQYGNGQAVPTSLFIHIPLFAFAKAAALAYKTDFDFLNPDQRPQFIEKVMSFSLEESYGESIWNEGYKESFGVFHDTGVFCCPFDDQVFERIKTKESPYLDSVIAGHDHTNNYVINYQDVLLIYALKTGAGCYYKEYLNGGTKLTFNENEKINVSHVYIK